MKEIAWVAEKDDWLIALVISSVGSLLLLFFIVPLSALLLVPSPIPYLLTGGIGVVTYKIRTTPKQRLQFRKGMRVFEYQKEQGSPLKPARFDQIVQLSVVPKEDYFGELSPNSFTIDDYWKTQLILEIKEGRNAEGEKIGEDLRMVIDGSAMNYENFLRKLIDWGLVEQGTDSTLLTFRIFPNHN